MQVMDLGGATLESYVETRRGLLLAADRLTRRMQELEPVKTMDEMERLLELDRERKLIVEMIASCSYVIEWLETGRRPGNRRGIERRAAYQREVPTDPAKLPAVAWFDDDREDEDEEEGDGAARVRDLRLASALRGLTVRERECYEMAHGQCCSFAEIAGLLSISKSSVGTYVVRAQRKISNNINGFRVLVG